MSYAKYQRKIEAGEAFHIDLENEKMTFTKKSSRKEKLLFVALLILLAIAVVFIILYALQVAKATPTTAAKASPTAACDTNNSSSKSITTTTAKTSPTAACNPADCVLFASGQFFQHSFFSLTQLGFICLHVDFYVDFNCFMLRS